MVAKRLDELARVTGPSAIAALVVTALGPNDSYYLCWKTKEGTYKQDSRHLPPRLQQWLFPTDGSTRDLASLQVVLGRDGGFMASDCEGKLEGMAEPRRLERASTLPLTEIARERNRGDTHISSTNITRASSAKVARVRASTLPSPRLAADGVGHGSIVIEGRGDTAGTLWMMKGLGGTMSTRSSTVTVRKAVSVEQTTPAKSPQSPRWGSPVATAVPLPWDMPVRRKQGSTVVTRDQLPSIKAPLSPTSVKSSTEIALPAVEDFQHQRKRSLASSTMFTSALGAGRIPRPRSPTKALSELSDDAKLGQPQSSPVSETRSSETTSVPPWERSHQKITSPITSPGGKQPLQDKLFRPSRPPLPPIDTTGGSRSPPPLPKPHTSPIRPPTPVVPTRRGTNSRPRRTITGPEAPAPLRLVRRPVPTEPTSMPAFPKPEGETPSPTPAIRSILKPASPTPSAKSPSMTRVPLNFTRRSRGAGGSLDMARVRASIANSVSLAMVDRAATPTAREVTREAAREMTQQWPKVKDGHSAGGKCFCSCHDGSFVVDAGVQTDFQPPRPPSPIPASPITARPSYSNAGIQTDLIPEPKQQDPDSYGTRPPKRSQVHWADWERGSLSEAVVDSSDEDFDGLEENNDFMKEQPGYMGRMTDYFRSPEYSLGDALG